MTLKRADLPAVGQTVRYYAVVGLSESSRRVIRAVLPDGIASCREPMVMFEGYAGAFLASHCFVTKTVSWKG